MKNKITLQKKLSQNTDGKITIWSIIAILLIGLFVWQFGADYLGINSITDYISDYDTPSESITFDYLVVNPVSHNELPSAEFTFDVGEDNSKVDLNESGIAITRYLIADNQPFPAIEFTTNAPYKLTNGYYCRIYKTEVSYRYTGFDDDGALGNVFHYDSNTVVAGEYSITHLGDITKTTFQFDLSGLITDNVWVAYSQSNFMEIYFYNPTGSVLFEDRFLITKEY